jgi:hypothetical protein
MVIFCVESPLHFSPSGVAIHDRRCLQFAEYFCMGRSFFVYSHRFTSGIVVLMHEAFLVVLRELRILIINLKVIRRVVYLLLHSLLKMFLSWCAACNFQLILLNLLAVSPKELDYVVNAAGRT